jgi:serine/threonine-protein kinase
MHPAMAAERDLVERFEREAQAAAKIGSSYVVDVLDLGDLPSGERYMVMEFLDGESLAARLETRTKMAPREIAPIALQLLEGLDKIHRAGILHRDLKPANIFLARTAQGDFVKILDLGVCSFLESLVEERGQRESGVEDVESGITAKYGLLGTPEYMSPEQILREEVDERTDIHQVGVVLYRAVMGRLPFTGKPLLALLEKITAAERTIEIDPLVEPSFAEIVRKAMARHPRDRFASAADLREAIRAWVERADSVNRLLADYLSQPPPPSIKTPPAFEPPRHTSVPRLSQIVPRPPDSGADPLDWSQTISCDPPEDHRQAAPERTVLLRTVTATPLPGRGDDTPSDAEPRTPSASRASAAAIVILAIVGVLVTIAVAALVFVR